MEYKRLSEVDMGTADDSTNVIAEVNGEIKRVPKSEVGGASGYIMTLTEDNFDPSTKVCTENYDEMYDVLMAGGSVWISIDNSSSESTAPSMLETSAAPTPTVRGPYVVACAGWQITDVGLVVSLIEAPDILFPNGSHNLESSSGSSSDSGPQ